MYEIPKCTCGEELEFDEEDNFCYEKNNLKTTSYGHCPKCGKEYQWRDHYVLSYWDELEELEW